MGLLRDVCRDHPDGPVFRNTLGRPWSADVLLEAFSRYGNVTPNQIRKWFATKLISQGVDSAIVAKLLGHSDTKGIGILTRHYHFPEIETLKRAVEDV
jgi:site-specific recombinase XerD